MRKFLLNILLFFAIIAIVDCVIGLTGDYLQSHAKGGDTRILNDFVMKDKHDVVIFGSSRAHHHYDTPFISDVLGVDVYNAGYDGNGVILAYGLMNLVLERYAPQLIIYDIEPAFDIIEYSGDNNHKRYISKLKPYYRHPGVEDIIREVSTEEWIKIHSGMLRYNSQIVTIAVDNLKKPSEALNGYQPSKGEYNGKPSNANYNTVVDGFKLEYIEKMIELAQTKSVSIMFVASPKYTLATSGELKVVKEICLKRNVAFIDYYNDSEFMLHKEWFKEPMHLNAKGAKVFSTRLIDDI